MALSADDEAFLDELLDTLQGKDALSLELGLQEHDADPELCRPPACGGADSSRGLATVSTRSGSVAQAEDAEAQHLLRQLGAPSSTRSPRMDPLGELLGCSDSEPWNDLLHRFCIQGDESIVEVLLDHLVQSGRDAGALIEALASADLAGLEGVVAEVTAGSAACLSARSACSSTFLASLADAPRSGAPAAGPAAGAEAGEGQARAARADAAARGIAAQRFEEIADPEEARNFMRLFLKDVRQRYLSDCGGDPAARQRSTVFSDAGGAGVAPMSARSIGTPSVMTIRDSESLQDCDEEPDTGDLSWA